MRLRAASFVLFFGIVVSFVGCKSKGDDARAGASNAKAALSASAAPRAPATEAPAPAPPPMGTVQLPQGPVLAIEAGKGVGPIRLGATLPTIERLMEAPCEVKTATMCRYIVRAVEFELQNGVTERITVQRHERPAGPDAHGVPQVYGFFNGGIPPGVALGMVPSAVLKVLGPPQSVQNITTANDNGTIQRATYPGMVLEFDKYKNGKVMLGAVIIAKAGK
ncbi:MAG: hypothetical protein ABI548_26930 [Polyangiaceae bacterium]